VVRIAQHTQEEGHNAALQAAKGLDFFRVHYSHNEDAAMIFEAVSSACQIVNK
jgi:hypothetical protein